MHLLKSWVNGNVKWKKVTLTRFSLACFSELHDRVKDAVVDHLGTLQSEFKYYFPELDQNDLSIVRNLFRVSIEQVDDELQDELMTSKMIQTVVTYLLI